MVLCGSLYRLSCLQNARELCGTYMPMHIAELLACIIFLCLKIFVCFIKQVSLLANISKLGWGGDDSILWLSFAQQKLFDLAAWFSWFLSVVVGM
jgi:hypothetical protein